MPLIAGRQAALINVLVIGIVPDVSGKHQHDQRGPGHLVAGGCEQMASLTYPKDCAKIPVNFGQPGEKNVDAPTQQEYALERTGPGHRRQPAINGVGAGHQRQHRDRRQAVYPPHLFEREAACIKNQSEIH